MAGSYHHVTNRRSGRLIGNEAFPRMIENLGDAYETVEEMYGMIWFLAAMGPDSPPMSAAELVELARTNYQQGLALSEQLATGR